MDWEMAEKAGFEPWSIFDISIIYCLPLLFLCHFEVFLQV